VTVVLLVCGAGAFFVWANRSTARAHARFQPKDVEAALVEVLAPDAETHDAFDLFLAWPIDDPYLESVRQQCLRIVRETDPAPPGQDLSDEGRRRLAGLLHALRDRDIR
jgi:hypothetical protein